MEKRIYSQLRANNRRKRGSKYTDPDERYESHEETLEHLRDFTTDEIKDMLIEDGIATEFLGLIGQGKEANVYWIKDRQGDLAAVKFFRIHTTSHNFNSLHARSKLSDTAKLGIASALCRREYNNIEVSYKGGARVPKPGELQEFAYTMELLGDEYGPAPLLRDVNLKRFPGGKQFVIEMLDEILDQLDIMFNSARLVHGDFSEHNIVFHEGQPVVIDFLQSQQWHPRFDTGERIRKRDALPVLKKDIDSILEHFARRYRLGYEPDNVFQAIAGDIEDWSADDLMSEFADPEAKERELRRI
ncbi:MAG: RIO1 family regulatory kinase/ATPase domain-containing protein [Candidatus Kariarchaeaceae archaeon]|jgi:RIO kinase 1